MMMIGAPRTLSLSLIQLLDLHVMVHASCGVHDGNTVATLLAVKLIADG